MSLVMTITYEDNEGLETTVEVPCLYEVCRRCRGTGSIVNPAVDGNGIGQEEFDADPDFAEAYFSGRYDIICPECRGERVTPVPVPKTPEHHHALGQHRKAQADFAAMYAMEASERRVGA